MPLLLLHGPPLSGKSLAAQEVVRLSREKGHEARLLDDDSVGFTPGLLFAQPGAVHARLKQQVSQFLSRDRLVVVDFVNCTKSFRYELFCLARDRGTRNCILAPGGVFHDGVASEEWLRPSRERYGEIVTAHTLLLKGFPPSGQRSAPANLAGPGFATTSLVRDPDTGWTYESYLDICSRLEPLLPDQKADNPVFLFPTKFAESGSDSESPLTLVCEEVLNYLYPLQRRDGKRRLDQERQGVGDRQSIVSSQECGVRGPQGTSTALEEKLLQRMIPILADYLP